MGDQRIGCHGMFGYRTIPLQLGNGRSRMPKPVVDRVKASTRVARERMRCSCSRNRLEFPRRAPVPETGSVGGSSAPRSDIAGAQEGSEKCARSLPAYPRNSQPRGKPAAAAVQSRCWVLGVGCRLIRCERCGGFSGGGRRCRARGRAPSARNSGWISAPLAGTAE